MTRGFACGVFDLFHPGHVYMLEECKEHCDHLTVAINRAENFDYEINPGKRQPIFTPEERALMIASSFLVDEIVFYNTEEELTQMMSEGEFDVRFLGDDYKGKPITAPDAIANIYYTNRDHGYSTTGILERIQTALNLKKE